MENKAPLETEVQQRLERCGVTATRQRIEVAKILLCQPQHLCADQILDRLRERNLPVSKATVYNTLNLFVQKGLLREVNVDPTRQFYDSTTSGHHHFYNVDSGELTDIPPDEVRFLSLPTAPDGTVQESVEVVVRVRSRR